MLVRNRGTSAAAKRLGVPPSHDDAVSAHFADDDFRARGKITAFADYRCDSTVGKTFGGELDRAARLQFRHRHADVADRGAGFERAIAFAYRDVAGDGREDQPVEVREPGEIAI